MLNRTLTTALALTLTSALAFATGHASDEKAAKGHDAGKERVHKAEQSFPITEKWSVEKLLALDGAQILAIWKTLDPPAFTELDGHYMGLVPNGGNPTLQKGTGSFMYNENSDIGYWLGKAYKPTTKTSGEGYNRWRLPGGKVVRNMRFSVEMGKSLIDGRPAYMMYYQAYNDATTLTDELRKLDDYIYLGIGTTELEDGTRSAPGHFILTGPTDAWVGPDEETKKK